jgi:hypothetical protein
MLTAARSFCSFVRSSVTALQPCKDIVLQAIGSRSIESANTFAELYK